MKVVVAIFGVIMIVLLFGTLLSGIDDARTDERVDSFAGVVTAPAVVEADVVLVTDIYDDDILNVVTIVSDNVLDAPLPDSYVPATNTLTVRGLAADDTRGLVITYKYNALTGDTASAGNFLGFLPLFIAIGGIMVVVGAIYAVFSRRF